MTVYLLSQRLGFEQMAINLHDEGVQQALAVHKAVLPAVGPPTTELEYEAAKDITPRRRLVELGLDDVVKHTLLQRHVALEGGKCRRIQAEVVDGNGVETVEKAVHVHLLGEVVEPRPVDGLVVMLDEEHPVEYLAEDKLHGGKV